MCLKPSEKASATAELLGVLIPRYVCLSVRLSEASVFVLCVYRVMYLYVSVALWLYLSVCACSDSSNTICMLLGPCVNATWVCVCACMCVCCMRL